MKTWVLCLTLQNKKVKVGFWGEAGELETMTLNQSMYSFFYLFSQWWLLLLSSNDDHLMEQKL